MEGRQEREESCKKNEVELHAALDKEGKEGRRGDTWENGTRPFLEPGVFYTWNFSGIYQDASPIFKVKFHRVTSRAYEREPPPLLPPSIGHERSNRNDRSRIRPPRKCFDVITVARRKKIER